ncbi:hypothetical protein AXE65_02030 [Ventosimonas gracilis]|uniref:Uncharacterized protein n=1 Tax=Ventosimonas gracilis TaxID=1680762 RepID=A0A139SUJ6_9GAMM|nr:hypothetical protein [Ventosimonas gracilis]KXU38263.1 hypothetical protein AXE65_02030 [Ventosimonas gracilis]
MTTAYELEHGNERLRKLIEFALREGWQVRRTLDGRLIFTKGSANIYTGATPVAQGNGHG